MAAPAPSERRSVAHTAALLPATRSYAVLWSSGRDIRTGRLDPHSDRLDLCGRERSFSIPFSNLRSAAIARGQGDRLRGLPVLVLRRIVGAPIRIASLEGPGVLHELAAHVERAGLVVAV